MYVYAKPQQGCLFAYRLKNKTKNKKTRKKMDRYPKGTHTFPSKFFVRALQHNNENIFISL